MALYKECPNCGASLDPNEKCDCKKENAPEADSPESIKNEKYN